MILHFRNIRTAMTNAKFIENDLDKKITKNDNIIFRIRNDIQE